MPTFSFNVGVALGGKALGARLDPYKAFNFLVEIDGIITGGFSSVSGLILTTNVDSIREGGVNDYVHKLPKQTTQTDLVLKKGQTDDDTLWTWYADVVGGKIARKNGSIYLLDDQGSPAMWWNFIEAFPISWTGPAFDASSSRVAIESMTLTHHGLTKAAG